MHIEVDSLFPDYAGPLSRSHVGPRSVHLCAAQNLPANQPGDSQNKNGEDSIWYERKQWAKQFGETNEYAADKLNRPKGLHLSNVKLAIRFAVGIELLKRLLWMQIYKSSKGCTRCGEQQCEEIKDQVPLGMSPTLGSPRYYARLNVRRA